MSSSTTSQARSIDRGTPPQRFARGWHCLGPVSHFEDGQPHAVQGFGGKLVVWKGMFHVFQSHDPLLPEGREAIAHIADFLRSTPPRSRSGTGGRPG